MGCLVAAVSRGYRVLGFGQATTGDEVFFRLVLARIIEPVSKLDSLRVLEEAGVTPAPYGTVTRQLAGAGHRPCLRLKRSSWLLQCTVTIAARSHG